MLTPARYKQLRYALAMKSEALGVPIRRGYRSNVSWPPGIVCRAQIRDVQTEAKSRGLYHGNIDSTFNTAFQAYLVPPNTRAQIVAAARNALDHASTYRYAQIRPMPARLGLGTPASPERIDCSAFSILSHHDGGAPNPNRADGIYDGTGWTGSIEAACIWVSTPLPGDFAMYDGHMAVCDGLGGVISDGHDPITHYTTPHYRSDFKGYMRSRHLAAGTHSLLPWRRPKTGGDNPYPLPPVPVTATPLTPAESGDLGDEQSKDT